MLIGFHHRHCLMHFRIKRNIDFTYLLYAELTHGIQHRFQRQFDAFNHRR